MDSSASPHKEKSTGSFLKLFRRSSTNGSKRSNHVDLIYGTFRRSKDKLQFPITKQESDIKDLIEQQLKKHDNYTECMTALLDHEWNKHTTPELHEKLQSTVNNEIPVISFLLRRIHQRPKETSDELSESRNHLVDALHSLIVWADDLKFKQMYPDKENSLLVIKKLDQCFKDYCKLANARETALESLANRNSNISIRSANGGLDCSSSSTELSSDDSNKRHSEELPPLKSIYQSPAVRAHIQQLLAMDEQITPPPKPPLPADGAKLDLSLYKGCTGSPSLTLANVSTHSEDDVSQEELSVNRHNLATSDPCALITSERLQLPIRTSYSSIQGGSNNCQSLVPSGDPNKLLNTADMEQELAKVTRSIQDGGEPTAGLSVVDGALPDGIIGDCLKTEVESDTEEVVEIIEHEGKKYRHKIKKRIVRTRQIQREVITSAEPPLGSDYSPPSSFIGDFPSLEDDHGGDDDVSPSGPPPDKPPLPPCIPDHSPVSNAATLLESSNSNLGPVQGYMTWFGQAPGSLTAGQVDSEVNQDSKQLFDYFRSIWHHSTEDSLPHERSKSVSYIQRYGQHNQDGSVVHRTTAVSQTRKIKLKSSSPSLETPENDMRYITMPSSSQKMIQQNKDSLVPDTGFVSKSGASNEVGSPGNSVHLQLLKETNARRYLLFSEDEMGVTGGCVDALIVYATTPSHNDFIFHETFLAFYRKFLSSEDLIDRLIYRYNHFRCSQDLPIEIRRESYYNTVVSFLIHVVSEIHVELTDSLLSKLRKFHERLLKEGEYQLAELLYKKYHHQWNIKMKLERKQAEIFKPLSSEGVTTKRYNLLQFSAKMIAEQMTLIDLEYFRPIHIEEMLKFTEGDGTSHCPNLMRFITNTNNTNSWVLTQILSKERKNVSERKTYLLRFFEISKVLQSLHNYNAYITVSLALNDHKLKGLRSQINKVHRKQIEELGNLLHHCEREQKRFAPVVPHLGKTLQYLIHTDTGNPNVLKPRNSCPGPIINMWKYWKIHTILSIFARKKKEENDVCGFDIKRNEEVLSFLNNYRDILDSNTISILADEINGKK